MIKLDIFVAYLIDFLLKFIPGIKRMNGYLFSILSKVVNAGIFQSKIIAISNTILNLFEKSGFLLIWHNRFINLIDQIQLSADCC